MLVQSVDSSHLGHHFSRQAWKRRPSPLKDMMKYMGVEGLVSLAGGLPPSTAFPFESVSSTVAHPSRFLEQGPGTSPDLVETLFVPKEGRPDEMRLSTVMQYSTAHGSQLLRTLMTKITAHVHSPPYNDWTTLMNTGNTDGIYKSFSTFCNPGEAILVEEWTYPAMMTAANPIDLQLIPVPMDVGGMTRKGLASILENWDAADRGGVKRPHVLYTIPAGQNPTGIVMSKERKMEIYALCSQYDIVIIEDDPYYFLQYPEFQFGENVEATNVEVVQPNVDAQDNWFRNLSPSYLSIDTEGRVVRLDTLSKTVAPGCRLGWFTCNSTFADRLARNVEGTTQAPCGFTQAIMTSLLTQWGTSGYIQWLYGLSRQYTSWRDTVLNAICKNFDLRIEHHNGGDLWLAQPIGTQDESINSDDDDLWRVTPGSSQDNSDASDDDDFWFPTPTGPRIETDYSGSTLFSFLPPKGGMFLWIRIHVQNHPLFSQLTETMSPSAAASKLSTKMWHTLIDTGLLVSAGKIFSHRDFMDQPDDNPPIELYEYVRLSFAAKHTDLQRAGEVFSKAINLFFSMTTLETVANSA